MGAEVEGGDAKRVHGIQPDLVNRSKQNHSSRTQRRKSGVLIASRPPGDNNSSSPYVQKLAHHLTERRNFSCEAPASLSCAGAGATCWPAG